MIVPPLDGHFRSADTTLEAARVQFAILRRMLPEKRLLLAFEMTASMRALVASGIRRRHPDYTEEQVLLAVIRLPLGDELFRQVYTQVDAQTLQPPR